MMTKRVWMSGLAAAMVIFGAGCAEDADEAQGADVVTPDNQGKTLPSGKADAWNWRNDPRGFRTELEFSYDKLPKRGATAQNPWVDTYWPMYQDGINARWQGKNELSPAEKYDVAFNGWTASEDFMKLKPFNEDTCEWDDAYYQGLGPAAKWISQYKGNATARNGRDDDGDGIADKDECKSTVDGKTNEAKLDGVESWWGICHAWAPASLMEQEPLSAVTEAGVTFSVSDLKGLLTQQYDKSQSYLVGGRCNDKDVKRDEVSGRIITEECRDLNAGSWHVLVSNLLGINQKGFVVELVYNYEVWNHPMFRYVIDEERELTVAEAHELLKVAEAPADGTFKYNKDATKLIEIRMTIDYLVEQYPSPTRTDTIVGRYTQQQEYHYILEIDAAGKVLGGEWVGESITAHPDFVWMAVKSVQANPSLDPAKVRELVKKSRAQVLGDDMMPVVQSKTYASMGSATIPDNKPEGVDSTIVVDAAGSVTSIKLDLDIKHTYRGDLFVELRHGGIVRAVFDGRNIADGWQDDVKLTAQVVEGYEGAKAEGEWTLHVYDMAAQDKGVLNAWSLTVETSK
jgi:subtilisin-like proprotein convertase family protein